MREACVSAVFQRDADAIHLAAGAHAFDDFLAGVAALGVADVGILQTRFVGNLLFAEVVAVPGNALLEARGAECLVAGGAAAVFARGFEKNVPERFGVRAIDEEFGAGGAARRTFAEAAGNPLHGDRPRFEFGEIRGIDAGEFFGEQRSFRAFERERREIVRAVGERDVVHDDVFVERGDQRFTDDARRRRRKVFPREPEFRFRRGCGLAGSGTAKSCRDFRAGP